MKNSVLIRSAVSNHLRLMDEPEKEVGKAHHLCWAIILECGGKLDCLPRELSKIPPKAQKLCELISTETNFMFQRTATNNDEINRQHQRAMYAEFLALYFEDIGD